MRYKNKDNISLCKNCWCETKTIYYKIGECGKCHQIKFKQKLIIVKNPQPKRTITFTSKNFDFTPVSNPLDLEAYEKIL